MLARPAEAAVVGRAAEVARPPCAGDVYSRPTGSMKTITEKRHEH